MRIILIGAGAASLVALGLGGCSTGRPARQPGAPLAVVAAESTWGSVAAQLAGPRARVTSIVARPGADPHDYEPTAADARALAAADLVVVNGIGYDDWARRLLAADPEPHRVVVDVGRLLGAGAGSNPHQWYSPRAVAQVVAAIAGALGTIDPAHRATYARRGRDFETRALAPYRALIAEIRRRFAGTPIAATESVAEPLAAALGLRVLTPASFLRAVAEGGEPAADAKATADAQIRQRRVALLVDDVQSSTPDAQRLVDAARAAHVPVVQVSETLAPSTATFEQWQTRQLHALLSALEAAA